ncbi:MAG: serine hydrolase [Cryomorphaceae bacterium]|nr:MAG: serine hydrolase [Cryomorphaceae bacterium]
MKNANTWLFAALVIFTPVYLAAQANTFQNLHAYLEALTEQEKFSGVVLVHKNEENVFHRSYGLADRERVSPMQTDHAFRIGSVTKSFTALLIAREVEKGKLSLETTVADFIPDYPRGDEINLVHLLSHTSGIANYFAMLNEELYESHQPSNLIDYSRSHDLLFEPGEGWDYSNTNYAILGYMLERLHNKPYDTILKEQIFTPCNMHNSGIDESEVSGMARGYETGKTGELELSELVHHSVSYAAGNIISNTEDMLRFSKALANDKLISKESFATFTTPVKNGYALGFMSHHNHGHPYIGHNGGNHGYQANWKYFPNENMHVVILCNSYSAPFGDIVATVADILFDQPFEIPVARHEIILSPEQLAAFEGAYRVSDDMIFEVKIRDNQLTFQATGQDAYPIFPYDQRHFFIKGTDITVAFEENGNKEITALVWTQSGNASRFEKLDSTE